MSFSPTPQQVAIKERFDSLTNGVVEALAGTGKTSTLIWMSEQTDRRGIIVTYNRDAMIDANKKLEKAGIAKSAGKGRWEGRVTARTAHSLAFGSAIKNRVGANQPRVPMWKAAQILGVTETLTVGVEEDSYLESTDIARLAIRTVLNFCHSADDEVQRYHVPSVPGAESQREEIRDVVIRYAHQVWADAQSPHGKLRYEHDYYLKVWALSRPKIRTEFLFLDEAQDANPVVAQVVNDQDHCQKIMVGDRFQSIYAWRGAVDAMSGFNCDWRLPLTQSFRFGQRVADEANKWLELLGAEWRLEGNPALDSTVEPLEEPMAILCRTNAACLGEALEALKAGRKVALAGGDKKVRPLRDFVEAAEELMGGGHTGHPDLVAFRTWAEVVSFAKEDEGADLRVWVQLIDMYGTGALVEACEQMGDEETADVVLSTAHSAKGRQWETVQIAGDFKEPEEDSEVSRPEAMLAYVAVTRAMQVLDPRGLAWVDQMTAAV